MCCSFNSEDADRVFKESKYKKAASRLQKRDRSLSFDDQVDPKQLDMTPQPGLKKGLVLVLDAHSDLVSPGTVMDDFRGFVATVGSRHKFPLTSKGSSLLRPGLYNTVALSAWRVDADEAIRSIDPVKRNCYFPDEYQLKTHKVTTVHSFMGGVYGTFNPNFLYYNL